MSRENVFLVKKSPEELRATVAELLRAILGNHVSSDALHSSPLREFTADDVFINAHLVDRAGALLNCLLALGYSLDASEWTRELLDKTDASALERITV